MPLIMVGLFAAVGLCQQTLPYLYLKLRSGGIVVSLLAEEPERVRDQGDQNMERSADLPDVGRVCRLGLATRQDAELREEDVHWALECGINYWHWSGVPDAMQRVVRELGMDRKRICLAVTLESRGAEEAQRELDELLGLFQTDYFDVVLYYYVERPNEWAEIMRPGGAHAWLSRMKEMGVVKLIGLTTHQRNLAARIARDGTVDLLMVRYNAAHRRAERDVFPAALERKVPVVAFTATRWGHLLQGVDGASGVAPMSALDCYRFVLTHPAVSVVLMAPGNRGELEQNLTLLNDWRPCSTEERRRMADFGDLVRQYGPPFP
jgi:predicted aldo/keto reductase-like oxidoreductase